MKTWVKYSFSLISKLLVVIFLLGAVIVKGQTIVSNCTATDSVASLLLDDVSKLSIRRMNELKCSDTILVTIPANRKDTIAKALYAIYNSNGLPAVDTVLNQIKIHARSPGLYSVLIKFDSSKTWKQSWSNNTTLTGDPSIDNIINQYNLLLTNYSVSSNKYYATFKSSIPLNIDALADSLELIQGIYYAENNILYFDGDDVFFKIYPDSLIVTFVHGWEDCPSGCILTRLWKFKVTLSDCKVAYQGSSGDPLNTGFETIRNGKLFSVYPTIIKDFVKIEMLKPSIITISDMNGKTLYNKEHQKSEQLNLQWLPQGIYILTLTNKNRTERMKIVKCD